MPTSTPSLSDIQGGAPGLRPALTRAALAVLSWGWGAAQVLKSVAYRAHLRRATALTVPVISVGNIAVGGTGKTPFVAWLAKRLLAEGHRPGILARGYGDPAAHADGLNDEGAVLRHLLGPDVPQVQDPDRIRGGRALLAAHPSVDVILLDDGFQHRRLHRDLDIVLLDSTRPFGFGHLLPRGLLRECPQALGRAGAIVLTRTERLTADAVKAIEPRVRTHYEGVIAHARAESRPPGLVDELGGARVFVVCGLGHPEAFLGTVRDLGAEIVGRRLLADHEGLDETGWTDALAEARSVGAECVVTTRKDAVKVARLPGEVVVIDMELTVPHGDEGLMNAVRAALVR